MPESAFFFEVFTPSGLVVEYGSRDGGKPLARSGVPFAYPTTLAHGDRGNAMTYGDRFAEADGYTAQYASTRSGIPASMARPRPSPRGRSSS